MAHGPVAQALCLCSYRSFAREPHNPPQFSALSPRPPRPKNNPQKSKKPGRVAPGLQAQLSTGGSIPHSSNSSSFFAKNFCRQQKYSLARVNSNATIFVSYRRMEQVLSISQPAIREDRISELEDIDGLVARYRAKVLRTVAFSLGDLDDAASITQDCFLQAYVNRAQYRGDCSVSTWLLQIAYNLVRDRTKTRKSQFWRQARLQAVDVTAAHLPSAASSSESQLLARERLEQVMTTLADLSPSQRTVFVLRFVEEMELPEIAAATGMALATVKTHLYRAIDHVRTRVGDAKKEVSE